MNRQFIELIENLSDPVLNGRVPGTTGHDQARKLIIDQMETMKLEPLLTSGWEQIYVADDTVIGRNILAVKKGNAKKDWLLLGAHYDHLTGFPGADDNAAAIGILLSVMDSLKNSHLDLNIVLAIFDMEEPPYFKTPDMGSVYFYRHLPECLDFRFFHGAIILDLCGHDLAVCDRENALFAVGAETSPALSHSINKAREKNEEIQTYKLKSRDILYLSDHYIFDINKKPNLFFSCGHWPYYHTKHDTFENLNHKKIENIAEFIKHLALEMDETIRGKNVVLNPFTDMDEALELGRFLDTKLSTTHLDTICSVLMTEISTELKTDLGTLRRILKELGLL
ncbi:M28 family metallopeptidase [Evansella tamaricis]|uniref:M28 family peptidase n=1 Tax=Evansella tamaricis TaxID=2069301 RepID=A0ABS6JJV8_9BACI|nr:M28 family peptidase [Evansella tamaricis]MBU9712730.1 M28 family peptidase [Evansella tamaricis]